MSDFIQHKDIVEYCDNKPLRNVSKFKGKIEERLRFTFTPNGKCEFVPRDEVFSLFFVYCLLFPHKNKYFNASFVHKNRSGLFLSAYFLF